MNRLILIFFAAGALLFSEETPETLNERAESYYPSSPSRVIYYADKALLKNDQQVDIQSYLRSRILKGKAYILLEKYRDADNLLKEIYTFSRQMNMNSILSETGLALTGLYLSQNSYEEAEALIEELKAHTSFGESFSRDLKKYEAELLVVTDKREEGKELYSELMTTAGVREKADLHIILGDLWLGENNPEKALEFYLKAYTLAGENSYTEGTVRASANLCRAYREIQWYTEALRYVRKGILQVQSLPDSELTIDIYSLYIEVLEELGRWKEAASYRSLREEMSVKKIQRESLEAVNYYRNDPEGDELKEEAARISRENWFLKLILGVVGFILVVMVFLYLSELHKNRNLRLKHHG